MKKLTALLLGTVIGIAFTASDAFADKATDMVKNYWNSNDGRTGGYLGVSYNKGSINDVTAAYNRSVNGVDGGPKSTWDLDDGEGGQVQFGFDFGKLRLDWRLGGLYSSVNSVDGNTLNPNASDEAVLGYSTVNFDLDLYRFELIKENFVNVAITPYVGAGYGYGGAWMTATKSGANVLGNEPAGHGYAHSFEAGVLVNLTDWAGVTLAYNYLKLDVEGKDTKTGSDIESDLFSVGVRLTY